MSGLPWATLVFWIIAAVMTATTVLVVTRPLMVAERRLGVLVMGVIPLVALPAYLLLGRPELTAWRTRPQIPPFLANAIVTLKQATAEHPDDPSSWVLLGDVDAKIQHYAEAEASYRAALKVAPEDTTISIALAQTLVREAGGRVTPDALTLFEGHATEPEARYYIAMAKSQSADWEGALADWQALARSAKPADPWLPVTQDRITEARRVLGIDRDR